MTSAHGRYNSPFIRNEHAFQHFSGLILLANVCLANFVPMKVTTVNQLVNHFLTNPGSEFQ